MPLRGPPPVVSQDSQRAVSQSGGSAGGDGKGSTALEPSGFSVDIVTSRGMTARACRTRSDSGDSGRYSQEGGVAVGLSKLFLVKEDGRWQLHDGDSVLLNLCKDWVHQRLRSATGFLEISQEPGSYGLPFIFTLAIACQGSSMWMCFREFAAKARSS